VDKKEKLLKAFALVRANEWEKAHNLVQEYEGDYVFDCIHALLHRQEGDVFNARWWYRNIGKEMPHISIEEELKLLEAELIIP
jgi:hypothetical protein